MSLTIIQKSSTRAWSLYTASNITQTWNEHLVYKSKKFARDALGVTSNSV